MARDSGSTGPVPTGHRALPSSHQRLRGRTVAAAPVLPIVDNTRESRFEVTVDGEVAFLGYTRDAARVIYHTTRVPTALEGRGIAGQLTKHALDTARASGLKVVPGCSFVASYVARHPEYADIVEESSAG